jgi:hypothetical protein
MAPQ